MSRFVLFPILCVCCLSSCSIHWWVPSKFPKCVHIEPVENWAVSDDNGNFYYWKNTEENQHVFQEWLKYTRNHLIGTQPTLYGLCASPGRLYFSQDIRLTFDDYPDYYPPLPPDVEFDLSISSTKNNERVRRANKYDRKLMDIIKSLIRKDNLMTPEDTSRIKQFYSYKF